MSSYRGPLRDEPIAVELHNTVYASAAGPRDGLADPASAQAFLAAIAPRLPADLPAGAEPAATALVALREAVRAALGAALDGAPPPAAALAVINGAAAAAPSFVQAGPGDGERAGPQAVTAYHDASRAQVILAAFAADAITLLTGPQRVELRACGAPRCVLMFLSDHPRRQWCSNACGNRARQARHYERTRPER
jgi:predicted RNA-binding Zn ribbon-like protein